jgi:ATP-dependent Clp protease ATP-binding subunit ClpC
MSTTKMTEDLILAVKKGREEAVKHADTSIKVEHIVYGILTTNNIIHEMVKERVEDFDLLLLEFVELNKNISSGELDATNRKTAVLPLDASVNDVVNRAKKLNKENDELVTVENFFLVSMELDLQFAEILKDHEVNIPFLKRRLNKLTMNTSYGDNESKKYSMSDQKKQTKTPVLDQFGRDLTALALQGKLDPVIGREAEVERVAQILTRRKKNNPVLIGDPGVGKTAIAEGLAIRISKKECPIPLQGKRVVALEMTNLVAGTKYRGEFEQRMKALIEELRDHKDVILFIDEMHTMVGAGNSSGALDAANVFKPALARGEVQAIGATTLDEYREHIEKDGALERRFQKVQVDPTNIDETMEILNNIKDKYEEFHNVTFTDDAVVEIVRLADRYITNREFPDKAIDIMDEAGSRTQISIRKPDELKALEKSLDKIKKQKMDVVKAQRFEEAASILEQEKEVEAKLEKASDAWRASMTRDKMTVTADMIAEVVSLMTGIPITKVSQSEAAKLLKLESDLAGAVIGQQPAIDTVASAIKRNRTGIRRKNRPIGTFLFVGPTGVGKTELAKQLASKVFGGDDSVIRIDMSEYQESHTVSRLIGAPPGYVGYNEGGQLTEKVRNKPYSVVLLDEIEKAHPKVFDVFLQLLDEGRITDGMGRTINFKNTIVIMTSNVGVRASINFGAGVGFTANKESDVTRQRDIITKEMKKYFRPEFLNRIDDIVFFNNLEERDILKIVGLQLKELIARVKEGGFEISFGEGVDEYILDEGYSKDNGAREMQRAIQKLIEDPISNAILKAGNPETGKIQVNMDSEAQKVIVEVTTGS